MSCAAGSRDSEMDRKARRVLSAATFCPAFTLGLAAAVLCMAWLVDSAVLAVSDATRPEWSRGRGGLLLMSLARSEARCGIGLLPPWGSWTGGYSFLHQNIPVRLLEPRDRAAWNAAATGLAMDAASRTRGQRHSGSWERWGNGATHREAPARVAASSSTFRNVQYELRK